MNISSLGDMAQSFLTRRQNASIKQDINRLTTELASNRIGDMAEALSGDFGQLASIERSLKSQQAYSVAASEAALFMQSQQAALDAVSVGLDSATSAMISAANSEYSSVLSAAAIDAESQFRMVVSTLNVPAAGRSTFSGDATDQPALNDAQLILDELVTVVTSETTAAGIEAALDDWFVQPGGGYETFAYLGSTTEMSPFLVGEGRQAGPGITALDPGVRETLKSLAMGALMKSGLVTSDNTLRKDVISLAAGLSLSAKASLTDTQAGVGVVQQQIELQSVRLSAEKSSFEIARSEMITADPFETATRLENAQFQLEALYAATARTSRLSLLDFLR